MSPSDDEAERVASRALRRVQGSRGRQRTSARKATYPKMKRGGSNDPQEVGPAVQDFLADQGWEGTAALAALAASWSDVVGPEVAEHVQIESVRDGELVLVADSTAWATQVRLLTDTVLKQVQELVSKSNVSSVSVRGPSAPSWRAGPRVVKGRGPRDTYG
jgi:predicted nucleic acid-binding Zn ribbon protein